MSDQFEIGNAISGELSISIIPKIDDIPKMTKVELFLSDDGGEWTPQGTYYVHNFRLSSNKSEIQLECYDILSELDKVFKIDSNSPQYPLSAQQILDSLNIPLDSRNQIEPYFYTYDDERTTREVLQDIALSHAGNFTVTDEEKLYLVPAYNNLRVFDVGTDVEDYAINKEWNEITGVTFLGDNETAFAAGDNSGTHLEYYNHNATQAMTDDVLSKLRGMVYAPFDCKKSRIDQSFELGDEVVIYGNSHVVNGFRIYYSANIRVDLYSPFNASGGYVTAMQRAIERGGGAIASVPLLAWDYNSEGIRIEQLETQIAEIDVDVTRGGNAKSGINLTFMSDRAGEAAFRVYDNEAQTLLTPVYKQILQGFNELTISDVYIKLRDGEHLFTVTAQTREGWMFIEARNLKYYIELYATENSPLALDIRDITILQPEYALEPVYVYAAAIDGGNLLIYRARYIEGRRYNSNDFALIWEVVANAVEAAIEFDGVFELFGFSNKFTLVTKQKPYILWIDENHHLYVQYGDEENTRIHLADNAYKISACRSWNSIDFPDQDAGLIAAYIKENGVVAYRALIDEAWATEEILTEAGTGNSYVQVLRLNDYRTGFSVTGVNKLFVTERTYVSQGVPRETVNFNFDTLLPTVSVYPTDNPDNPVNFDVQISNDWLRVHAYCNFPLLKRVDNWESYGFSAPSYNNTGATITELTVDEHGVYFTLNQSPVRDNMNPRYLIITFPQNSIVAVDDSGCFVNVPQLRIDYVPVIETIEHNQPAETVNFNIGIVDVQILPTPLLTYDYEFNETINFNIEIADIEIIPAFVEEKEYGFSETVNFNIGIIDIQILPTFVGVIPV
jgi:hypothetical protein